MSHKPICLKELSFILPHKTCFEHFNTTIHSGAKIGIIGANGSGKSTLLRIIQQLSLPSTGRVVVDEQIAFGFVSQLPEEAAGLSGAQQFNKSLTQALATDPDVLCLDEPTNHLDIHNRRSLMLMLQRCEKTLLIVSHDVELLRTCIDTIWFINDGVVTVFDGNYDAFMDHQQVKRKQLDSKIVMLEKNERYARDELRRAQERSARRARANKNENDRNLLGYLKRTGNRSLGKHQAMVGNIRDGIMRRRALLYESEELIVHFEMLASRLRSKSGNVIEVLSGTVGYQELQPLITEINLLVRPGERVTLRGVNASGKSTIIKALMNQVDIIKTGDWHLPKLEEIGYLDQHYKNLPAHETVFGVVQQISKLSGKELRVVLNDFLFRKNEEVNALVSQLSGGERCRLALACIALQQPSLLLLDEATNNLDLQTREYLIQVLTAYPGTVVVISHDEDFLQRINISTNYEITAGKFLLRL
ncbi:ABC-F family ATP-binding cassette domain-containing protein [Candidatus Dependentiae bacterium]|nr:ABC-F family ATP-binding cassette domain-containing protein [Candidatus Dependentiae bacterium]